MTTNLTDWRKLTAYLLKSHKYMASIKELAKLNFFLFFWIKFFIMSPDSTTTLPSLHFFLYRAHNIYCYYYNIYYIYISIITWLVTEVKVWLYIDMCVCVCISCYLRLLLMPPDYLSVLMFCVMMKC